MPASSAEAIRGWNQTERRGEIVTFSGFAESSAGGLVRYELIVTKSGRSGRSNSQQAGQVRLEGNAPRRLSQSSVNIADGDDYCAQLAIYQGNMVVARQFISPAGESATSCGS